MARSMIQRRQEAERLRIEAYAASLRRVSQRARPAPDLEKALAEAGQGFKDEILRAPDSWRPNLKTRDAGRLRLAAARHLFARYPVPEHLEQVWFDDEGLDANEVRLRKRWYIVAAGGGSLYKAGASEWLSRKEVHCFLNPPGDLDFCEAFWFAIARGCTDDMGLALRIARSKIARMPRQQLAFWREAVRFFVANPATREEINDLCDYLQAALRRDAGYSLKGRTLASLRRQMGEWHRYLAAIARIEALRRRIEARNPGAAQASQADRAWPGSTLADWEWQPSTWEARRRGERFVVRQLKKAEELVAEGQAMHHCVSSYAAKCITGNASIWTLRRVALGKTERLLTIELGRQHRAVQVRGFANRVALPDERKILERWAKARGILLPS